MIIFHINAAAQKSKQYLSLGSGIYYVSDKEAAYSPLIYDGISAAFSGNYTKFKDNRINQFLFQYSGHTLSNRFQAEMRGTHASLLTHSFYKSDKWLKNFLLGWSKNNELIVKDFVAAQNFTPRVSYHTSFGLSARYDFLFGNDRFRLSFLAHIQCIGFILQSSMVTGLPDPFLYEDNTPSAFLRSIRLFHPFKQWNMGTLHQISYVLPHGNEICLGYRFQYSSLEIYHRSLTTSGFYFFQLNFIL
jgi:hypothetical protein